MSEIKFVPENIIVTAETGEQLLEVARRGHIFVDTPCNGNGSCGKCKLKVLSGSVEAEKSYHISEAEAAQGVVLACTSKIEGDLTVESPGNGATDLNSMKIEDFSSSRENEIIQRVMAKAEHNRLRFGSSLRKDYLELELPDLDDNISDWDRIVRHLQKNFGYQEVSCGLATLKEIPLCIRKKDFRITVTHQPENSLTTNVIRVEAGNTCDSLYGAAIDVGTTSVAAFLVDLRNGQVIAKASAGNAQIKYGADVINRIIHATRKDGLLDLNRSIIQETINPLFKKMYQDTQIDPEEICALVIAGNTTMMQLLLSVYPDFLRKEPYIPTFLKFPWLKSSELKFAIQPEAPVYLLPSVASYVGGDITAGVLASGLWAEQEQVLFLDLGTNGEIVLGNKDYMLTCACSAGPAFEGGGISCGMRASGGAIEKVTIDLNSLDPQIVIIDQQKPKGISGSGIIDAVAEMFKTGIIDSRGRINKERSSHRIRMDEYEIGEYVLAFKDEWNIEKDITITEIDLENFIRAKGAVYAAVATLLSTLEMDFEAVDKIVIAGGIGNNIDIANAITIGLFPDLPLSKYEYIGNSSLLGSYLALTSQEARVKLEEIAAFMTYVELSAHPSYMSEFVSACFLPHTDIERFPTVKARSV